MRQYIIEHVERHAADIAKLTAEAFGITRQAVSKHLRKLVTEGALSQSGNTKSRSYRLAALTQWQKVYPMTAQLAEDRVWREDVTPSLGRMPKNVLEIWHYGFTEMFNNAIDHSEGTVIGVEVHKTAATTEITIHDDGVGIFRKIQSALGLIDQRHAVLELAKGKLTTDPARHTGEGIFFASRMFEDFDIVSGGVLFSHSFEAKEDWILEQSPQFGGTNVRMKLDNLTSRTTKKIFDRYTSPDDYGFTKTVVPVKLAQYAEENLVSRSQAKRLLARFEKFQTVVLDFRGVESIGQAFADEIFRVFSHQYPKVTLLEINANSVVTRMIVRARGPAAS